jgi:predicted SnoaL-like aldol condensation-catalyzing enzyme
MFTRRGGRGAEYEDLGNLEKTNFTRGLIMLEENKALVRRYYEEVMGSLANIEEIISPTFVDHHFPPEIPPGPAGVRRFFTDFMNSIFSEPRIEIEFLLAEGDKVDCHFVFYARHTGDGAGIAPRGNAIRVPAISTFRIAEGQLAEAWEIYDSGDMLQQMQTEEA